MTRCIAVIPARWASSRFPGKVLAPLSGRPVLLHVLDRVARVRGVDDMLVATDDPRVVRAVESAGYRAVITRDDHSTGSDRIAEALEGLSAERILNVQGDEPLVDPRHLERLIAALEDSEVGAATLAVPIDDGALAADPNCVKVVCDATGRALYFSRSLIPGEHPVSSRGSGWLRHLGVYAWRREEFERFTVGDPTPLELREGLEQLRYLERGGRMRVEIVDRASPGVDTPEDLARCEALLARPDAAM
jgi:3-deoxy-manno-octulosonate cytidylyltransferase (CMP-KDO synthetase)